MFFILYCFNRETTKYVKQVTNGMNAKVRNHHPQRGNNVVERGLSQADLESVQAPLLSW